MNLLSFLSAQILQSVGRLHTLMCTLKAYPCFPVAKIDPGAIRGWNSRTQTATLGPSNRVQKFGALSTTFCMCAVFYPKNFFLQLRHISSFFSSPSTLTFRILFLDETSPQKLHVTQYASSIFYHLIFIFYFFTTDAAVSFEAQDI